MTYKSANTVQTNIVRRLPTGLDEIDFLYGFTEYRKTSRQQGWVWGIPEKSISLWAGETGVGKSRFAIEVARKVARKKFSVIYFQNEMPLGTFVQRIKSDGGKLPNNLYVSESTKLDDQLQDIRSSRAQLVFVDSINMLEDFGYGSDKSIKKVIEGYRDICNKQHCSIIQSKRADSPS
jgi:predicted ATP-dependent serine protease